MKRKKGFTLIELIAVLVILAILALIVTPLVMNIIRKAKISADKRSIDAYGRSIELAIASYLLDEGKFPTSIDDLSIEYSGDIVECSTAQLNSDSSVYLAGCTVGGRSVDYTYGKEVITYDTYEIGDTVTYNNIDFYVIKDSNKNEESVTLLKAEPLSYEEMQLYGVGHINNYASWDAIQDTYQKPYNINGYGGMAYYSSETCGYPVYSESNRVTTDCKNSYDKSDIKYVVDDWALKKLGTADYKVRLITKDELESNFEFEEYDPCNGCGAISKRFKNEWIYSSQYPYWTMTAVNSSMSEVYVITRSGYFSEYSIDQGWISVRPVITINKNALSN